jgi:Carboxypeptidase regulatory-like domain
MNRMMGTAAIRYAMSVMLAFAVGGATTASAQVFTGRIDVTIEDTTGGRLPGVNVDLAGPVSQTQISDAEGQAHFLNLPVGTYTVKASLSGFNPFTNSSVQVASGSGTPLAIKLSVAGTAETVNVTAATPIVDVRRETTTTNVTLEELQNIPTARDPWVVMQTVPTIYVDRVNVGGSESGQQSTYIGKGSEVRRSPTWARPGRRRPTTTSTCSRRWRSRPAAPTHRTRRPACS